MIGVSNEIGSTSPTKVKESGQVISELKRIAPHNFNVLMTYDSKAKNTRQPTEGSSHFIASGLSHNGIYRKRNRHLSS